LRGNETIVNINLSKEDDPSVNQNEDLTESGEGESTKNIDS